MIIQVILNTYTNLIRIGVLLFFSFASHLDGRCCRDCLCYLQCDLFMCYTHVLDPVDPHTLFLFLLYCITKLNNAFKLGKYINSDRKKLLSRQKKFIPSPLRFEFGYYLMKMIFEMGVTLS